MEVKAGQIPMISTYAPLPYYIVGRKALGKKMQYKYA